MFEHSYYGSASHIQDLQEEQIAWMSVRNGILFDDEDDEPVQQDEPDDEPPQHVEDEPPTFQRVEHEPDDFRLALVWWLR